MKTIVNGGVKRQRENNGVRTKTKRVWRGV